MIQLSWSHINEEGREAEVGDGKNAEEDAGPRETNEAREARYMLYCLYR